MKKFLSAVKTVFNVLLLLMALLLLLLGVFVLIKRGQGDAGQLGAGLLALGGWGDALQFMMSSKGFVLCIVVPFLLVIGLLCISAARAMRVRREGAADDIYCAAVGARAADSASSFEDKPYGSEPFVVDYSSEPSSRTQAAPTPAPTPTPAATSRPQSAPHAPASSGAEPSYYDSLIAKFEAEQQRKGVKKR